MLLSHAVTLAEARSYVAALADHAGTLAARAGYEYVLLRLDALHGGDVPPLTKLTLADRSVLFTAAESAIEDLLDHGADGLQIELVLALLEDARSHDVL